MLNHSEISRFKDLLTQEKPRLQKRFALRQIGIFGSVARGEATATSDVDILIDDYDPDSRLSLFDIVTLEEELSSLFQAKVDVVALPTLKRRIGEHIFREVESI